MYDLAGMNSHGNQFLFESLSIFGACEDSRPVGRPRDVQTSQGLQFFSWELVAVFDETFQAWKVYGIAVVEHDLLSKSISYSPETTGFQSVSLP